MKELIEKAVEELSAQDGKKEKTIKFSHHASSQNKSVAEKCILTSAKL